MRPWFSSPPSNVPPFCAMTPALRVFTALMTPPDVHLPVSHHSLIDLRIGCSHLKARLACLLPHILCVFSWQSGCPWCHEDRAPVQLLWLLSALRGCGCDVRLAVILLTRGRVAIRSSCTLCLIEPSDVNNDPGPRCNIYNLQIPPMVM